MTLKPVLIFKTPILHDEAADGSTELQHRFPTQTAWEVEAGGGGLAVYRG